MDEIEKLKHWNFEEAEIVHFVHSVMRNLIGNTFRWEVHRRQIILQIVLFKKALIVTYVWKNVVPVFLVKICRVLVAPFRVIDEISTVSVISQVVDNLFDINSKALEVEDT